MPPKKMTMEELQKQFEVLQDGLKKSLEHKVLNVAEIKDIKKDIKDIQNQINILVKKKKTSEPGRGYDVSNFMKKVGNGFKWTVKNTGLAVLTGLCVAWYMDRGSESSEETEG